MTATADSPAARFLLVFLGAVMLVGVARQHALQQATPASAVLINREPATAPAAAPESTLPLFPGR